MKKTLLTALCTAALAAIALPAFADHQIGGYYRFNGVSELMTAVGQADGQTADNYVDQRLRARWQNNINEYVTVVWFGEVDVIYGEGVTKGGAKNNQTTLNDPATGKPPVVTGDTQLGGGGRQGGDGVNVETKNAFLAVKIPNTPVSATLGLQGFGDTTFNSVVMNDDLAGVKFDVKTDMVTATVGWFKLSEGNLAEGTPAKAHSLRRSEDDSDLYVAQAGLMPVPGLKLMPEFWFANNQQTSSPADNFKQYYAGMGAAFKLAPVDLSAWFVYEWGKNKGTDVKITSWAASAKAGMDVAGAKLALRGMYFPKSTDADKQKYFTPPNSSNGAFEFYDDNLTIFLADINYMNTSGGRLAMTDGAYTPYGMMGAVLSGSFTPPALKQLYVKGGAGYFTLVDDKPGDFAERQGKSLGTEVSAAVGYKVADKADVQLRGGYAWLGKAYDGLAAGGSDPDNLYKLAVMVNVPY
ncbi:MAG: hypothetical protein HZB55_09190 [Deltaproteobacteria bacterium]|nr:hypothetical protein [Deltaproteobacteria bacterium]